MTSMPPSHSATEPVPTPSDRTQRPPEPRTGQWWRGNKFWLIAAIALTVLCVAVALVLLWDTRSIPMEPIRLP